MFAGPQGGRGLPKAKPQAEYAPCPKGARGTGKSCRAILRAGAPGLYAVTPASTHDGQVFEPLLDKHNTRRAVWADSAYASEAHTRLLRQRGIANHLQERPWRDQTLTRAQRKRNRQRSRVRARVGHVFGH